MKENNENQHATKRLTFGIVVLLIGGLLLIKNLNIFPPILLEYIFNWRTILILVGIVNLTVHKDKTPGFILLFLGLALYLPYFINFHFNFWHLFWPVMLILIGVLLIVRKNGIPACQHNEIHDSEDYIDEMSIFGGSDKIVNTNSFKGGRMTCIFGGSSFNLARCHMAPGKQYIDMFAVFGGTKLIVPEDWRVKVNVVSIFGGFKDGRFTNNLNYQTDSELIIKGFVIFGGGEIKSF